MKPDDPMVSDEGMNVLLAPVVQAVAAYGRAESDRMGAVIVLAAYGVVEFRCRALIRAAVKRGLEMAADFVTQPKTCDCAAIDIGVGVQHEPMCGYPNTNELRDGLLALAARVEKEGR